MLKDLFSKRKKTKNDLELDNQEVKVENIEQIESDSIINANIDNDTSIFESEKDFSEPTSEVVDNVIESENIEDVSVESEKVEEYNNQDEPIILDAVIEEDSQSDIIQNDNDYTLSSENRENTLDNLDEQTKSDNVDYADTPLDSDLDTSEHYLDEDFDYDFEQEDDFYDKKSKKSKKKEDVEKSSEKKEDNSQNVSIKIKTIAMKSEESKINAFDLFFIKLWVMLLGVISLIADGINYIIFKIFHKKAPKRYVRAFVFILFIVLIELCIILPIALT